MSAFRQWLVERRDEAATLATEAEEAERFDEWEGYDADRALWANALARYDAEHPAHDPLTCPCCLRYGAHIVELEEEHDELVELTEEIQEAGRALATLVESRIVSECQSLDPIGECPWCTPGDDALTRWAKANGRWSMRESAGGNDDE